jgi:hypothetical protein
MGIVDKAKELLKTAAGTVGAVGAEAVTKPVKDITGAAKDVVGIRKDLVETQLAERRLKNEESLILKATLEDVKEFDQKTRKILDKAKIFAAYYSLGSRHLSSPTALKVKAQNRVIGSLSSVQVGKWSAKDRRGRIIAVYDIRRHRTYTPQGRILSKGNVLMDVIRQQAGLSQPQTKDKRSRKLTLIIE